MGSEKPVEEWLDQRDLERLGDDQWSTLHGYEDKPHSTYSRGRKAPNITWEDAEIFNICDAQVFNNEEEE